MYFCHGLLGLFSILAYSTGHLVQAVGNLIEAGWWKAWGGMPTDWIRSRKHPLLAPGQVQELEGRVARQLNNDEGFSVSALSGREWYAVTHQVYAAVAGAARASRVDVFNGNYGLHRGLAASFGLLAILTLGVSLSSWRIAAVLIWGASPALYRMHRFARNYARELFVQFLELPTAR